MGEYADDMLNGFACEGCGDIFDDCLNGANEPGYPRRCDSCRDETPRQPFKPIPQTSWGCMVCLHGVVPDRRKMRFKSEFALAQHMLAKHQFKCPDCEKVCTTPFSLTQHRAAKHPGTV